MALSTEDRDEIVEIICAAMRQQRSGVCLCDLGPETQQEMGHFFGRLKDLGDGNLSRGIEIFSKVARMMVSIRSCGEKIGGAVAVTVFTVIAGGIMTAIWMGIRTIIIREP
jgi:hypothetical protein